MPEKKKSHNRGIKTVAIIPSAGSGVRMGEGKAKQFRNLCGKPLLAFTLEKFQACPEIDCIILVAPGEDLHFCEKSIVEEYGFNKVEKIVAGGKRRQDSVRIGLEATEGRFGLVLIHDGVRPLVEIGLIEDVVSATRKNRAVITAIPSKDTVKKVGEEGFVLKTCERELLWLVQTPQAFRYGDIMAAHEKALVEGWNNVTDDAFLIEKMGLPVKVIEGSEYNIKITTPHDMGVAEYLLKKKNKKNYVFKCDI